MIARPRDGRYVTTCDSLKVFRLLPAQLQNVIRRRANLERPQALLIVVVADLRDLRMLEGILCQKGKSDARLVFAKILKPC